MYIIFGQIIFQNFHQFKAFVGLSDCRIIATAPLIYAGGNMEDLILRLINSILKTGQIPDILKVGLVTPIFKNKGDKNNSTNYRGITVMPAISKIMETILRERIAPIVIAAQNQSKEGLPKTPPQ